VPVKKATRRSKKLANVSKNQQPLGATGEWDTKLAQLRKENKALEEEAAALRNFISALTELMDALHSPRKESEILTLFESVLDSSMRAIGASEGSLLIPDESSGELIFAIVRGATPKEHLVGKRVPAGKGVASWVFTHRQSAIVNNAAADERFYKGLDNQLKHTTHSILAAPLIGGGRVIGVVEMVNKKNGRLFSNGNQRLLAVMSRFAGELLFSIVRDVDLTQSFKIA
jgi:transcriptional regulator with GAF, ATPase, and Fis domain